MEYKLPSERASELAEEGLTGSEIARKMFEEGFSRERIAMALRVLRYVVMDVGHTLRVTDFPQHR